MSCSNVLPEDGNAHLGDIVTVNNVFYPNSLKAMGLDSSFKHPNSKIGIRYEVLKQKQLTSGCMLPGASVSSLKEVIIISQSRVP